MNQTRVLLAEKLAPHAKPLFDEAGIKADIVKLTPSKLMALVEHGEYAALVVRDRLRIPRAVMEAAGKSLKLIGIVGDSLDNVNVMEASRLGIVVKITEYGNTYEAANLAKRLMIFVLSKSFQKRDTQKAYVLQEAEDLVPKSYTGFELADKTVGLVGCGRVAQALAIDIVPHCKRVLGYDNNPLAVYREFHLPNPLERPVIEYCQLSEICERADVISIHTGGRERVFLCDEIYHGKNRPFIINTARDSIINEKALLQALKNEWIQGAAFTVPSQEIKRGSDSESIKPFLSFGNVVIAPSQGKPVSEAHKKNTKVLARAVIDYLTKDDMSLAVNPPERFGGEEDTTYPLSVQSRQVSLPLKL